MKFKYVFYATPVAQRQYQAWDGFEGGEFSDFLTAMKQAKQCIHEDVDTDAAIEVTQVDETGVTFTVTLHGVNQGRLYVVTADPEGRN